MTPSASAARRRNRSRSRRQAPPLSDLDQRILSLLSHHRVLTQNQLAAIEPQTPERTLRYRCARLARRGLLGRTRPYRERGSAPHHLWPTRKGEAIACGGPPPRGGERQEPNPLFLAHAAGLSEIYVALETTLPAGVELARFEREAEAREPFSTWMKHEQRAIAPDVFIEIADGDGGPLLAFIELDMGTMSHRRLKQKAAGYAEYAKADAWRERHDFCPALLFVTTTEKRARAFLAAMEKELGRDALLLTCASDLARRLGGIATEERWLLGTEGEDAVDLLGALREARRPWDEERERIATERQEDDAERERLRSDPAALRSHLRSWRRREWSVDGLGEGVARPLEITLEGDGPLAEAEHRALLALGAIFADPLHFRLAEREPTVRECRAFADLADHCRAAQLRKVADLALRFGEGPELREARRQIEASELLSASDAHWLEQKAADEERSRAEQARLADAYFAWREEEARRLFKAKGFAARLRSDPGDFLDEIDRRSLRLCRSCEEIAYPDPKRARYERARQDIAFRCHFCGGGALAELDDEGGAH
ncbi:MAG: replication-relaxation family protein [Actinobacteria bacterium]|nr:replication-relaxation family protein [Actinomycetota bacterium]